MGAKSSSSTFYRSSPTIQAAVATGGSPLQMCRGGIFPPQSCLGVKISQEHGGVRTWKVSSCLGHILGHPTHTPPSAWMWPGCSATLTSWTAGPAAWRLLAQDQQWLFPAGFQCYPGNDEHAGEVPRTCLIQASSKHCHAWQWLQLLCA